MILEVKQITHTVTSRICISSVIFEIWIWFSTPVTATHQNQTKIYYHPDLKAYNPQNTPF
jgi:hypothetical protein